jgi:REP element-mobilizing transposase RayT
MANPIYAYEHLKPAFHLRYTWTGWTTAGTQIPPRPNETCFEQLDTAWKSDNLKRIATNWQTDKIQFTFSTVPTVAPTVFVGRVKGRLQHALRLGGTPVKFSRKVAFRGIGENHTREVQDYVQTQVEKEQLVDPRFSEMLKRFTVADDSVALDQPSESNSGRYWYNLHVVLVVASRGRIRSEDDFTKLDRTVQAVAKKHQYGIAARAWMPDHLHVALRGNIEESPAEIALSLMNNTAFAMGQNELWQRGFYAGTFSEYDVRAVGR